MTAPILRLRSSRRAFLLWALAAPAVHALGRRRYGGALRLDLPLSLAHIDPHAPNDPASALVGHSIADPLFAWDTTGRPYPALAARMPDPDPEGARVVLRPGLVTARGKPLDGKDVAWSLARAQSAGARPLLARFGVPRAVAGDPLGVVVPGAAPDALADALASPVTAIVPRRFSLQSPDGTGAFRATRTTDGFVLERNLAAARGASYLDRVELRAAPDLAFALRAFESGDADLGFLGAGLHRRRTGAVDLRTDEVGFFLLRTGKAAGTWGAPGVAQGLVSAMDPSRFSHLGFTPSATNRGDAGWGGPPADLLVDERSPYLVEIAQIVADVLSRPGHAVNARPLPVTDLRRAVDESNFALAIDFTRKLGPTPQHTVLALLSAADPKLSEKPPHFTDVGTLTRTLPLAVLGALSVSGAVAPGIHGLDRWDLGAVFRDA